MAKETLSHTEIDSLLSELERKMSRLRTIYEQYFMGIERRPPTTARKDVVRVMRRLENIHIKKTAQKFRHRSLVQRFNSYKTYWNRVSRQIEEGTYARDRARADRRQRSREREELPDEQGVVEIDLGLDVDLRAVEREMNEWVDDQNENAEQPLTPGPAVFISDNGARSTEDRELIKNKRLAEIEEQLQNPDVDAPADDRKAKMDQLRQRFSNRRQGASGNIHQQVTLRDQPSPGLPTSGASVEDLRRLKQEKDRILRERRNAGAPGASKPVPARATPAAANKPAVAQRDGAARQVYERLVEAKRRCNESTKGLTFDSVSQSMAKQRERLRKKKGAKEVDFQVVIKDGKAFLKPVTK